MDLSSVQEQIHDQAKSHLAEFAAALNVPAEHQYLIFGRPEIGDPACRGSEREPT